VTNTCQGGSKDGETCEFDKDCEDKGECHALPDARIIFYDMSNPEEPVQLPCTIDLDHGAGAVGLAKLPDGHYLLAMLWDWSEELEFWRSNKTSFFDAGFKFEYHDTWYPPEPTDCDGFWPVCNNTFQNVSFVNQLNDADDPEDDQLFMIAGRNTNVATPIVPGDDELYLYEITGFNPGKTITLDLIREGKVVTLLNDHSYFDYDYESLSFGKLVCTPSIQSLPGPFEVAFYPVERTNADLLAGGTTHVTPSGELLFYAVTHYHDGVFDKNGDRIVRIAELRHKNVVRDGSPTYRPLADPGGPYTVDEGSTIVLGGEGSRPTLAAPWVQLFEHSDLEGQSVMVDFADKDKDDFNDFGELDGDALFWPCLDLDVLAEITAAGKTLFQDDIPAMNLTWEDFFEIVCYLFEQDGECWTALPTDEVKGHKDCWQECLEGLCWEVCGPCRPIFGSESENCTFLPAFEGIPGFPIPGVDINRRGWTVIKDTVVPEMLEILAQLPSIIDQYENCGRLFGGEFREPPESLNVLNLNTYEGFIDDLESFYDKFGDLEDPAKNAISDLLDYCDEMVEYIDELITTIHGFNDRASSVRYYAPDGVNVVLYDKTNYNGKYWILEGDGFVHSVPDLSVDNALVVPGGSAEPKPNDRIRSVRFTSGF
jgi:hypothetical protein